MNPTSWKDVSAGNGGSRIRQEGTRPLKLVKVCVAQGCRRQAFFSMYGDGRASFFGPRRTTAPCARAAFFLVFNSEIINSGHLCTRILGTSNYQNANAQMIGKNTKSSRRELSEDLRKHESVKQMRNFHVSNVAWY